LITYFSKITIVEQCLVVDQAKIALTVVQKWNPQNEVIALRNTKFSKNHHVKEYLISNSFQQILLKKHENFVCNQI